MLRPHMMLIPMLVATASAQAADPAPEIRRDAASPQATGLVHTLRTIPEACARLEGRFTGNAGKPYDFAAVRTSDRCAPRAKLVDAANAKASVANGWVLNDVIRVPSAACPSQQAVVSVWRLPVDKKPELDGQGQSRIYLEEAKKQAAAGQISQVTMFAAQLQMEGKACN